MKKSLVLLLGLAVVLVACSGITRTPTPSIMVLPSSWNEGQVFQPGEVITLRWTSANDSKFVRVSLFQDGKNVTKSVFLQKKEVPGLVYNVPPEGFYSYMATIEDTGSYAWEIPSLAPGRYALQVFIPSNTSVASMSPSFVVQ